MNKQDFINRLRQQIAGIDDYMFVNDTIAYYEDYIDSEIRKGKTEEQVLSELGDPRLIAKSILATRDVDVEVVDDRESDFDDRGKDRRYYNINGRRFSMPGWLHRILLIIAIVLIMVVVFTLISWLMPFILVAACGYCVYRLFKNLTQG